MMIVVPIKKELFDSAYDYAVQDNKGGFKIPLPLGELRFPSRQVTLTGGWKGPATNIGNLEWLNEALNLNTNQIAILTETQEGDYGNFAAVRFFARIYDQKNSKWSKPTQIGINRYEGTDRGTITLDHVFDGQENTPTVLRRAPPTMTGHNGAFSIEFTPIYSAQFTEEGVQAEKRLLDTANEMSVGTDSGKRLIYATVPAGRVPEMLTSVERETSPLEDVFQEGDVKLAKSLAQEVNSQHNCMGDGSSCVSDETLELTGMSNMPGYRVGMDSRGHIYTAERVLTFPSDKQVA